MGDHWDFLGKLLFVVAIVAFVGLAMYCTQPERERRDNCEHDCRPYAIYHSDAEACVCWADENGGVQTRKVRP